MIDLSVRILGLGVGGVLATYTAATVAVDGDLGAASRVLTFAVMASAVYRCGRGLAGHRLVWQTQGKG